jgi:DNA-binding NarL/FixJ family response regulator
METDELRRAILTVSQGGVYLSPAISASVVEDFVRLAEAEADQSSPLTSRQREILQLIAASFTTKAIARRLNISVKTVEAHRSQLMDRLQIHDVAGLVRYAIRAGLVDPEN